MIFKKKERKFTASVRWWNQKGQEKTLSHTVKMTHKNHVIVLRVDGKEFFIKVEL